MKANVGGLDRGVRIAIGSLLAILAVLNVIGVWGYVGIVPILTGLTRRCPAYLPFGLSSCKLEDKS
jgi:hypothetical protein